MVSSFKFYKIHFKSHDDIDRLKKKGKYFSFINCLLNCNIKFDPFINYKLSGHAYIAVYYIKILVYLFIF